VLLLLTLSSVGENDCLRDLNEDASSIGSWGGDEAFVLCFNASLLLFQLRINYTVSKAVRPDCFQLIEKLGGVQYPGHGLSFSFAFLLPSFLLFPVSKAATLLSYFQSLIQLVLDSYPLARSHCDVRCGYHFRIVSHHHPCFSSN